MNNIKTSIVLFLFLGITINNYAQVTTAERILSEIRNEGFNNSKAMKSLSEFTDIYGQRLTGSRNYYKAAQWVSNEMKQIGLKNVRLENN